MNASALRARRAGTQLSVSTRIVLVLVVLVLAVLGAHSR